MLFGVALSDLEISILATWCHWVTSLFDLDFR